MSASDGGGGGEGHYPELGMDAAIQRTLSIVRTIESAHAALTDEGSAVWRNPLTKFKALTWWRK